MPQHGVVKPGKHQATGGTYVHRVTYGATPCCHHEKQSTGTGEPTIHIGILGTGAVSQALGGKLAEQIQAAYPRALVVKTLDTVTASLMVNPRQLGDGEHNIFVGGNDAGARAQVAEWLRAWFGWKHIIDLGDITSARALEMYLPLWLRLFGAFGSPMVNVKVVTSQA